MRVDGEYQPCTSEVHLRGQTGVIFGQGAAADGGDDYPKGPQTERQQGAAERDKTLYSEISGLGSEAHHL